MDAERPLAAPIRTCFRCRHFAEISDRSGIASFCALYDQPIDSEVAEAADCPDYEVAHA